MSCFLFDIYKREMLGPESKAFGGKAFGGCFW